MWALFSKYIVVGVANTLLTMIVIFMLMHSGVDLYVSNAVGYLIGIIFSFIVNSLFTFSSKLSFKNLVKFFSACFMAYLVNLAVMKGFLILCPDSILMDYQAYFSNIGIHIDHPKAYIAQLCGMVFYTIAGFILNKFWVMKR